MTGFFELLLGRTSCEIPLPKGLVKDGSPAPTVILCDGRLRLDAGSSDLAMEGEAHLAFAGFPYLGELLPDEKAPLGATVRFDKSNGLTVTVEPGSEQELSIDLPTLDAGNRQRALGRIAARVGRVGIKLPKNADPALDVVLLLKLPEGLNQILGGYEIFETTKAISTTVTLGPVDGEIGAGVTLGDAFAKSSSEVTSPLKAIAQPLIWDGTNVSGLLDLGGAGTVQIRVPKLAFGDGVFTAHGGFTLGKEPPPGLPLWPFKSALRHLIGDAVDGLPDYLPLQDLSVLDEKDTLNVENLVKALITVVPQGAGPENWLHETIDALRKVLEPIKDIAKHLPERLKEYLRASPFRPGQTFNLDIDASPAGSLDVRIECQPALRLLVPTPSMLLGLELGEFSLGPILGGSLLKLKVDARIDTFDLTSLAVLLPQAEPLKSWLPDISNMQTTLVASELLALIEYESPIPIPVPLLAKELGFNFVGIGGLQLAGGVSCHLQRDGILDILDTVRKLFNFITQPGYSLTADDGHGLQLMVGVDETYLQLPKLVGGQVIGSKTAPLVPEEDAVTYAFRLLNALKGLSLAELVRSIPLPHRVHVFNLDLGPAKASGGAALTTTDEFLEGFAQSDVGSHHDLHALSRDKGAVERLLDPIRAASVPATGEPQRSGIVTVAAGTCSFGHGLSLEAQSAAALIGPSAFAGSFHLGGKIAGLSLDLSGCAHFDLEHLRDERGIGVTGEASLKRGEHVVCQGGIAISGAGIGFAGSFDSGPPIPELAGVLHLSGKFNASLSRKGFSLRLAAVEDANLTLLGVCAVAQQFELTSGGLVARLTENVTNVGKCTLTLGIADFVNLESYFIRGSIKGQITADATQRARSNLEKAYGRSLTNASTHLKNEIKQSSYLSPSYLSLKSELAVIEALQEGEELSQAIGKYASDAVGAVTTVLQLLGPFGQLAKWSPAQWITVTELRLRATVGKPKVTFDVYGSWWGGGTTTQKLLEIPFTDVHIPRLNEIIDQLVVELVKFVLPRQPKH